MLRKKGKVHKQEKRRGINLITLLLLLLFITTFNYSNSQTENKSYIDKIEEKIFHQSYSSEPKDERLSRIENFLFGRSFPAESTESRVNKISSAVNPEEEKEDRIILEADPIDKLIPEKIKTIDTTPSISNEGVIGLIDQIETKMFSMTFNDYPFQARISALEDRILSREEVIVNRSKALLDRVIILLERTGLEVPKYENLDYLGNTQPQVQAPTYHQDTRSPQVQPQAPNYQHTPPQPQHQETSVTYSIDPNTGFLINQLTGDIVRDLDGNKIMVMPAPPIPQYTYPSNNVLPQQFGGQQNQYGIPGQNGNQIPYELFFNPNNFELNNPKY